MSIEETKGKIKRAPIFLDDERLLVEPIKPEVGLLAVLAGLKPIDGEFHDVNSSLSPCNETIFDASIPKFDLEIVILGSGIANLLWGNASPHWGSAIPASNIVIY